MVVKEIKRLARYLQLSTFTLSFFVLGILTSLPEISIGISAVVSRQPEIFVGTLIGGSLVLFLLVIPLLAIIGNGVRYPKELKQPHLIYTLLVVVAPTLLVSDRQVTMYEAIILVGLYLGLFLVLNRQMGLVESLGKHLIYKQHHLPNMLVKISGGLILMLAAGHQIVRSTEFFAGYYQWSEFVISLLLVSVGTNVPEISLVIRSVIKKDKSLAFADYLGSAVANTIIFGVLAVIYGSTIVMPNHFIQRFIFLLVGLVLFYFFTKSKQVLSRWEGIILILLYAGFVTTEMWLENMLFPLW